MFSSKRPNYPKLKTNLRLAVNRLKLLEKKKTELALKSRREIADYIKIAKDDRARIRVEHIIREDYLVEAMEIIEMFCDLLLARFGLIEKMVAMDPGLEECIATLIWVTPRLSADVAELKEISKQLTFKYGKEYADACMTDKLDVVNEKVVHKLGVHGPPKKLVEQYMIEIASTFNIDYVPDESALRDDNISSLLDLEFPDPPGGGTGRPPSGGGRGGGGGDFREFNPGTAGLGGNSKGVIPMHPQAYPQQPYITSQPQEPPNFNGHYRSPPPSYTPPGNGPPSYTPQMPSNPSAPPSIPYTHPNSGPQAPPPEPLKNPNADLAAFGGYPTPAGGMKASHNGASTNTGATAAPHFLPAQLPSAAQNPPSASDQNYYCEMFPGDTNKHNPQQEYIYEDVNPGHILPEFDDVPVSQPTNGTNSSTPEKPTPPPRGRASRASEPMPRTVPGQTPAIPPLPRAGPNAGSSIPELPSVPSHSFAPGQDSVGDIDFDDLTKRFEELKRKK